jgi:putative transposase
MTPKELLAFAKKAAKSMKTEKDLCDFSRMLKKVTVEAALGAEFDDHLGNEKHQASVGSNSRNGHSNKTVYTDDGAIEIDVPRDRESSFEPQLIKKQQTRLTGMDDKILFVYAQGMTTREICIAFKELYDSDVSASLISKVTNPVLEQVIEWQSRPLDQVYSIVSLARLHCG